MIRFRSLILAGCIRQAPALARNGLLAAGLGLLTAPTALASTPLSGATSVSVTDLHSCAIVNGGVKCWGDNQVGQLGDGTTITRSLAVDVEGLGAGANVTAVAAGYQHTCALVGGGVQCWGRNAEGQLGIGYRSIEFATPQHVIGLGPGSGVTAVAAGQWYTCAIANGGVLCWGDNFYAIGTPTAAPQEMIPAGSGATAVSVGDTHSCAVVNGGVECWGFGNWGQLGDGTSTSSATPVVAIPQGSGVSAVDVGYSHTCALAAGLLSCWGTNEVGQLGTGVIDVDSAVPVPATVFTGPAVRMSVGGGHTCAVANGGVQCWGYDLFGQLGIGGYGANAYSLLPVSPVGLGSGSGAADVSAGLFHTCAVVGGGIWCWGYGEFGSLGNGNVLSSSVPVQVVVDDPVVNTAPTLDAVVVTPSDVVSVGTTITAGAGFADPDQGDTHTCSISWGDGSVTTPAPSTTSCADAHAYATAGVYIVTIAVTDSAGGSASGTYAYVVAFDPAAGSVTGGGWFESPAGAYRADASVSGRANFGFVAKYQNGRSVPDGHAEFQVVATGLRFRSSSYEWLTIVGGEAVVQGAGTIDGAGDYTFQLSVIDGARHASGQDRVRLIVRDRATGAMVYDNDPCGSGQVTGCATIAAGQVVIHAAK